MGIQKLHAFLIAFTLVLIPFPGRAANSPSTHSTNQTIAILKSLYPGLDSSEFQDKLDGAKDPFHFLRTFVPFYYWLLKQKTPQGLAENPVVKASGWCVGDAHLENFGILLDPQGDPHFTMNDFDDAGPCPLYADLLRFLVSSRLYDPKIPLNDLLNAYSDALMGNADPFSDLVHDLKKKAKDENGADHKMLNDDKTAFKDDPDYRKTTTTETSSILSALKRVLGTSVKILDSVSYVKASGGSGGLKRYRALVTYLDGTSDKPTKDILEFKSIDAPGIFPLATGPIPAPEARLKKTVDLEAGVESEKLFSVETVLGAPMLVRHRWKGDIGIRIKDYSGQEIRTIAQDEANALGRIHLNSANDLANYRQTFRAIPLQSWESAVQDLTQRMSSAFTDAKGN